MKGARFGDETTRPTCNPSNGNQNSTVSPVLGGCQAPKSGGSTAFKFGAPDYLVQDTTACSTACPWPAGCCSPRLVLGDAFRAIHHILHKFP